VDDAAHAEAVVALWALLGAAGAVADAPVEPGKSEAAARAQRAIARARGEDGYLLLVARDGSLLVNGRRLRPSLAGFAAAHGLAEVLRASGVGEVLFDAAVDVAALWQWAAAACAGVPGTAPSAPGVHQSPAGEAPVGPMRRGPETPTMVSNLASVFLQHRLHRALPALPGVAPAAAKAALALVVDRLLAEPLGLEWLQRLDAVPGRLDTNLQVAVVVVLLLRGMGWPPAALPDAGVAALLHDCDPAAEQGAAAGWAELLGAGPGEHWLLWAIVARSWREARVGRGGVWPFGAEVLAVVVHFAVAAVARPPEVAERARWNAAAAECGLDDAFVRVAAETLAGS
jgi:hypothetical protein